jgi:hypothetical protein
MPSPNGNCQPFSDIDVNLDPFDLIPSGHGGTECEFRGQTGGLTDIVFPE